MQISPEMPRREGFDRDLEQVSRIYSESAAWQGRTIEQACPSLIPAIDRLAEKISQGFTLSSVENHFLKDLLTRISAKLQSDFAEDHDANKIIAKIEGFLQASAVSNSGSIFASREKFQEAFDQQLDLIFDPKRSHYFFNPITLNKDFARHAEDNEKREGSGNWYFGDLLYNDSTGVYKSLENIRQLIYSAMQKSEHSVVIPWEGMRPIFFDIAELKQPVNLQVLYEKFDSMNPAFLKDLLIPALIGLMAEMGAKVEITEIKDIHFIGEQRETGKLNALHFSWDPKLVPGYPIPNPPKVSPPPTFNARLAKIYQSGERADFEITCKDGSFKAHKFVLALCSDYFASLQSSDMKEAQENKLDLPDIPGNLIKAVLDYIYLGKNPYEGVEKTWPDPLLLLELSHIWEMPELHQLAANVVGQNADLTNYQEIGELGKVYRNKYLLDVYNCLNLRTKKPIPEDIEAVMVELSILKEKA